MTTYHIFKADCLGASRIMLQSDWEGRRSSFIHRARPGRAPGDRPELRYSLASILRALGDAPPGRAPCLVFHMQSTLPLLFMAYLLRGLVWRRATFVYDIHDLHERESYRSTYHRLRYGVLRYYPLRWLERWAVTRRDIHVMTVSDGLARTVAGWYRCPKPLVVHSALQPQWSGAALRETPREKGALLFFGTAERLPVEMVDNVGSSGLRLHLYGRFGGHAGLERKIGRPVPEHVQIFGEYSPNDLSFIGRYRFLLLYKPDDFSLNFRYSLPNKFFQSLAYGTSLILSANFEEMAQVASSVPAACAVLHREADLASTMAKLDALRTDGYWDSVTDLSRALHDTSRQRYRSLTSGDAETACP